MRNMPPLWTKICVVAALVLHFVGSVRLTVSQTTPAGESPIDVKTPATTDGVSLAISPDGSKIVFVADTDGKYRLWLHSLTTGMARPLPGTDDVSFPFPCWSPDSRSIAFVSSGRLRRIDTETGISQALAAVGSAARGCSWNRNGSILFAFAQSDQIFRISDQGGRMMSTSAGGVGSLPVAQGVRAASKRFIAPQWLPDGKHFLCYADGGVYAGEIGGASPRQLLTADSAAAYSMGHLLFVRQGTLYARAFDAVTRKLSGAPFQVAEQVPVLANIAAFSVSASGQIAYRTGPGGNQRQFKWFDRTGKELESVGSPVTLAEGAPEVSPDGSTVALRRTLDGNSDIWLLQVAGGALTRLTSHKSNDGFPVWSADGRTIYFASNRRGPFDLFQKPAIATGTEKSVADAISSRMPRAVSPDGRVLLFTQAENIFSVELKGKPIEKTVAVGPGIQEFPQFSPDGRLLAFQSNESGRFEISIQQFPAGIRIPVTSTGGAHVRWNLDGRELFYMSLDGRLMSVAVVASPNSQEIHFGTPAVLFAPPIVGGAATSDYGPQYTVSQDGQRFLIATAPKIDALKIIRNWRPQP